VPVTQKENTTTADSSPLLPALSLSSIEAGRLTPALIESWHSIATPSLTDLIMQPALDSAKKCDTTNRAIVFPDSVPLALYQMPDEDAVLEIDVWNSGTEFDSISMPMTRILAMETNTGALAHIPRSDPIAHHRATLVMQALRAFPRMMLRKPMFPPFIHSHGHLPKALAHCMSIAHIFVSPSVETKAFLWQSIEREQGSFLDEASPPNPRELLGLFANSELQLPTMQKETLLSAIQAQLIYILMRVALNDPQNSAESSMQMVITFQILSEAFMKLCDEPFCLADLYSPGSTTWADWIFAESRRRTACVWFLLSRVVCVKTGITCDATERFRSLPLPCAKSLWEARTEEEWVEEYKMCGGAVSHAGLDSFGDLMEANERLKEVSYARRLDVWNANADKLGTLLNAAVSTV